MYTNKIKRSASVFALSAVIGLGTMGNTNMVTAASPATANFTVSASVVSNCNLSSVGNIAFGDYDPVAETPTDQSATFNVRCTKGTAAVIGLSAGANASGGVNRMTNGTDFLSYNLYSNSGRTVDWKDTAGNMVPYNASSNAPVEKTIYARIPALQDVSIGNYTDTVQISVTF